MKIDSIICFAGGDWWYHHPHSYNHLMKTFSEKYKVLYINSIPVGSVNIKGKSSKSKIKNKIISLLKYFKEVKKNLYVFTPFFIPFAKGKILLKLNVFLLKLQINFIMKKKNMKNPLIWITNPYGYIFVENTNSNILYQIVDKISAYKYSGDIVKYFDDQLTKKSAIIITPGKEIYKEKHNLFPEKVFRIKHGVDMEHFAKKSANKPIDFPNNNKPVFTYWGSIDYKKVYYDLLKELSENSKHIDYLFIGRFFDFPVEDFEKTENIHFIGSRDYNNLPDYAYFSNGFIIPWDPNDEMNKHASPIKLREYLATGKPIVTTYIPEFDEFENLIYISHNNEEFVENMNRAINEKNDILIKKRKEFIKRNDWRSIANEIENIFTDIIN